jgi:hypothetical protein
MQRTFEVSGPVELDVRVASGEIEIDPSLEGRVEVDLSGHDEISQRLVEEARVELRDGRLLVDVPQRRGGFGFALVFGRMGVSCRIRCPEGSGLAARTKSADVLAHGRIGRLEVATASGDVEADRVTGNAGVKSASGDVEIRSVGGSLSVQTASGDVGVDLVRGAVTVSTASGDLMIGEAYGDVSANTVSGDQRHGAVMRGRVAAHAVSGDVTIGVRRGSTAFLDCSTVSGDTSSELDMQDGAPEGGNGPLVEVRAKTVSGDIRITRAPAPANDDIEEVTA